MLKAFSSAYLWIGLRSCLGCLFLLGGTYPGFPQLIAPQFTFSRWDSNRWLRFNSSFRSNTVLTLEASTNFTNWKSIGTMHDALYAYPDADTPNFLQRYYRLQSATRSTTNDWKNQILFPTEAFRSTNSDPFPKWVKFAILLDEPTRVFYQDSRKYAFHYDFATTRLAPFLGMNHASFDALSLYRANQQVVLGAVLYPSLVTTEYGVQFVGLDAYTPDEISQWFKLVTATVYSSNQVQAFYMPTFEQSELARANEELLASRGIVVSSADRWTSSPISVYSPGWALGRLKYFAGTNVVAAFADGRLRPEDILLTDGVPADTPMVAGIISLAPATPNSHTAILARSFGVPFLYFGDPADRAKAQALIGRKIVLTASVNSGISNVKLLDVEGLLDPAVESEMLSLKIPEPIDFLPKQAPVVGSFGFSIYSARLGMKFGHVYTNKITIIGSLDHE